MVETETYKIKKKFITKDESNQIIEWLDSVNHTGNDSNYHLSELSKKIKGKSCIFDISNTPLTNYITKFQSISDVSLEPLPDFLHNIIDRIVKEFNLPKDNIFLQAVDMNKGGKINPHYDASIDGYVNYKCNISVLSEDYNFFVGDEIAKIEETDLYCFEASLYKHWTNEFNSRRIFLSFGFVLKYEDVNREINDPRIRLSQRIGKYFQKLNEILKNKNI
ncbi:hypothetical protein CCP3SC1AL1_3870003 [Gammaproteobacteria bacterium]